jgi:putative inorganic carbon (HCO3(-)) transporter
LKSFTGHNASVFTLYNIGLFIGLLAGSLLISFLVGTQGIVAGAIIVTLFLGLPILLKIIVDVEFGLYFLIWYGYFLFLIARLVLPAKVPTGIGVDVIEGALLLGILLAESGKKKWDWSYFKNPVTYLLILLYFYNILQVFNPNAVSLTAWIASTRGLLFEVFTYFIVVKLFTNLEIIKKFTKWWLFLALLAALYGFFQEYFGYQEFEWRDIYSSPQTIALIQNIGILRKFSFMSDVTTFGILMAAAGVFCSILALGPVGTKNKIILSISALLMFISMSFSGTRTATAIVPVGLMIYILMNITNRNTLILLFISIIGFCVILFGPFYGGVVTRIRTTFEPSKDASMNVREFNRKRIQPYIHEHPFGGGVNTTDGEGEALAPGHPLAGFATDGGYLKTALTTGWIGLILLMAVYFTTIAIGVTNFYRAKNPFIKSMYGAYIAFFFALLVANYTQSAMLQKPTGMIVYSILVIMPNLIKFDDKPEAEIMNKKASASV